MLSYRTHFLIYPRCCRNHFHVLYPGFYEVAELLLSKGADVDPICENGGAPVHIAAKMGHAKVLKLLLQNKADVIIPFLSHS
jgi:ankyrin repeat protein